MKDLMIRLAGLLCVCALIPTVAGCSLTKTRVSSEVSYTSGDIDDTSSGGTSDTSAPSDETSGTASDGKPTSGKPSSGTSSGSTSGGNVVSGGGKNDPQNAGDVDNTKEEKLTGTLELQIFTGGYGSECWEYAIDAFQKLQPSLEINAHLDANVNAQMKTRWAKDNPPDFVLLDGTNMPKSTWMEEGKLRDLSDLYKNGRVYGTATKIADQIKSGLVTTYKSTGKILEMPVLLSTYGMWYDQTYLSGKGWSVPKNYTELTPFCKTVKGAGTYPLIYTGQYSGYLVWGMLMPAVASEAAASKDMQFFYDIANAASESVWADARFKKVLTKIKTLADAGYFDPSGLSMNHITSQAAWLKHNAVLIPNGLWLENEMKDSTPADFKMRYYPSVLQDKDQPTCVIASSTTVGISAKAKNPKAAEAFLRFLYTDESARKFAELCAVPSAARTDMSSAKLTDAAKQVNDMINSSQVELVAKGSTTWGSVDATINQCINKLISGSMTVDKMIEELQKATKKKVG